MKKLLQLVGEVIQAGSVADNATLYSDLTILNRKLFIRFLSNLFEMKLNHRTDCKKMRLTTYKTIATIVIH